MQAAESRPSCRFSPLNGEVILKGVGCALIIGGLLFQSPQWGSNSKDYLGQQIIVLENTEFQSPQWGSNSKVHIISAVAF